MCVMSPFEVIATWTWTPFSIPISIQLFWPLKIIREYFEMHLFLYKSDDHGEDII